ncbi:hypothetical protein HH212_22965 [Massilia forsythiae]|uniref:Uncharacterized protein n=1 Tax=Massilia forsythiae TaxID=2728020 RepID=A0A7Z2VZW2_9BURK|nr:hypothetical protein [Massilia forsythiae]QJE02528.1 hypothetical protein HH212_22965 [Massilia forsythiae]
MQSRCFKTFRRMLMEWRKDVRDEVFKRGAPPNKRRAATVEDYARHRMGLAMDRMGSTDCPTKKSQSARWAIAWGMALRKARSLA